MYKALIIGAGKIAAEFDSPDSTQVLTHAHAISLNKDMVLDGFYDVDVKKAENAVGIWGGCAYTDIGKALKNAQIVICCVPDAFHAEMLLKVAEYRPQLVIAEKPIAATLEEAESVRQAYEGKIPLMLNYSRRYIQDFYVLKEKIKSYGKLLKGVGYYGKGILHNGSHMIDFLRLLFCKIDEIVNTTGRIGDYGDDETVDATLRIGDALFSMIGIDSRCATIFEIELFFEKARVRILSGGSRIEYYPVKESEVYKGYYNYVPGEKTDIDNSKAMQGLMDNAVGFLNGTEEIRCSFDDGLAALKLCMAIRG